jgi:hypothetical protein
VTGHSPAPAPTPAEAQAQARNSLTSILQKSNRTFEDMIALVVLSRLFDSVFQSKILLFDDDDITNIQNGLGALVNNNTIKTIDDVQTELIKYIDSMSNNELNEVKATYFIELFIYAIDTIEAPAVATSVRTNYSSYQRELMILDIRGVCLNYSIVNDATRLALPIAKSKVLCELKTRYPLIILPTGIITTTCPNSEGFQNNNDRINEELKKKLRLIFKDIKDTKETFINKKIKRKNNFSGYSLENSALLPKDYAEF